MVSAWRKTLTFADFTETFDGKTCQAGTWLTCKYKVPAQQVVRVGTGAIVGGVDDRGILFMSIKDNNTSPAQLDGNYRVTYMDANELKKLVVKEGYTDTIRTSKTARDAMNVLPETAPGVREDSYIVIEFLPNAAAAGKVIETANSELQLPVTIYTK